MKSAHLFIVYDSNRSMFIDLESSGKYIYKLFSEHEEYLAQDLVSEFHLGSFSFLNQYFLGPFPDSNEIKKIAYEIGEFYEADSVVLLNKDQYGLTLLESFHRDEFFNALVEMGDIIKIDPDSSNNSLWNKIFN